MRGLDSYMRKSRGRLRRKKMRRNVNRQRSLLGRKRRGREKLRMK